MNDERKDIETAILAMAAPYMAKLTVDDLQALCALADEDGIDLASMAMNPALWRSEVLDA